VGEKEIHEFEKKRKEGKVSKSEILHHGFVPDGLGLGRIKISLRSDFQVPLGITLSHSGEKAELSTGRSGIRDKVMVAERISEPVERNPVILGGYEKIKEDIEAAK
jgi:hypothetical protein